MNRKRVLTFVPVAVCIAAVGALLIGGLTHNVMYFRTVSEAVDARVHDGSSRVRVAGAVVPGTVRSHDGEVGFDLTDGRATVHVEHHGDPPELFKDGAPIVSEGRWAGDVFDSDRLMIKHGSDYAPPTVDTPHDSAGVGSNAALPTGAGR